MDTVLTIVTLLLILLPVAAKAIEKTLVNAGKSDTADKVRRFREQLEDSDGKDADPVPTGRKGRGAFPFPPVFREAFPTSVIKPPAGAEDFPVRHTPSPGAAHAGAGVPAELLEDGYKSVRDIIRDRHSSDGVAVTESEEEKRRKLEIDPRKMIIYSEIMKPKF